MARRISTPSASSEPGNGPLKLQVAAAIAALACVSAMVVLHLSTVSDVDTGLASNIAMGIGLGGVGVVLVSRERSNPIGWLMVVAGAASLAQGVGREWAVFVVFHEYRATGAALAAWIASWTGVISLATLPLALILLPDGNLPDRRWRPFVYAVAALAAVGTVGSMFSLGPFTEQMPQLRNPLGVNWPGVAVMGAVGQMGFLISILIALAGLVTRTRHADSETRQQLRWIATGATVMCATTMVGLLPWRGLDPLLGWIQILGLGAFLASVAVAVLRYRLWDLNILIRQSVVYGLLITLVTAVYLAVVAMFGHVTDRDLDIGPALLAAAAGAAAFALLRDHVQRRVERSFFGYRNDPYSALSRLGERLESPDPAESILDEVVVAVAGSLCLASVTITDPDGVVLAMTGTESGEVNRSELIFRDLRVGELGVTPLPGSKLRRADLRVLGDLARPVAAVVHAMVVTDELQRSRRDLVTAREAERRKIRRNLHDGLGPALAAVRMKLDSAALLLDDNPDAAKAVIDQLGADLRATIGEVRRLVYDLQPPELDEVGLVESLAQQARSFSGPLDCGTHLLVQFSSPESLPELPAAFEVAAYRIACEALANVARHSRASECTLALIVDNSAGTRLRLLVDDNGVGLPEVLTSGVGTLSMTERAKELGGSLAVGPSPLGGTRVCAELPLSSSAIRPSVLRRPERSGDTEGDVSPPASSATTGRRRT